MAANLSGEVLQARSGALKASVVAELAADADGVTAAVASTGVPLRRDPGTWRHHGAARHRAGEGPRAGLRRRVGRPRASSRLGHPGTVPRWAARLDALRDEIAGGLKDAVLAALGQEEFRFMREPAVAALLTRLAAACPLGGTAVAPAETVERRAGGDATGLLPPRRRRRDLRRRRLRDAEAQPGAAPLRLRRRARSRSRPAPPRLNAIMDALDGALAPTGADAALGRCTLGGTAWRCSIEGKVLKDPGDLDGDALLGGADHDRAAVAATAQFLVFPGRRSRTRNRCASTPQIAAHRFRISAALRPE